MLTWDLSLLHYMNQIAVSPAATDFFTFITDLHKTNGFRLIFLPFVLGLVLYFTKGRAWRAIVVIALAVSASDLLSHRVIKPFFDRPRPFVSHPEAVTLRLPYQPGGLSFPSNHAANMTTTTLLLAWYIPSALYFMIPYALLVMYSRPYLGVHFPSDILGGITLGLLLFLLTRKIVRRWLPTWAPLREQPRIEASH